VTAATDGAHTQPLSLCPSVLYLTLSLKRKGIVSLKLAEGKPMTRLIRDPITGQRLQVKVTRLINAVTEN